jgi:TPR repeat protein
MPRIIFKCRYLKGAAAHAENLVTYIATREGVEKIQERMRNHLASGKQNLLIADILERFPDSMGLFEYEDYMAKPNVENASEFISAALDQNLDQLAHREVYVNYIATRPRAERLDTHGLFSDDDSPLVLSKVAQEVAQHTGNIWTPIISLRREDAARLGYDNAAAWMALLRKQRNLFADQMKIAPENLRWYASFHNESHHPHCHMIVYSVNPREGFVTRTAIEKMRSTLAGDIFRQDLIQLYEEQTVRRNVLTVQSRDTLSKLLEQLQTGTCENPEIEKLLSRLVERLRYTGGKKQYGYLKAPLKELVNKIVDELEKDERVAAAYAKWQELRNEVLFTYKNELPPSIPLSGQKEFKQVKNMVIAEAVRLGSSLFTFEGDENAESSYEEESVIADDAPELPLSDAEPVFLEAAESQENVSSSRYFDVKQSPETGNSEGPHIAWNDRYKKARVFLFGNKDTEPDFERALTLLLEEAKDGNALAMHDLGRMYVDGLGMESDADTAFDWYKKALDAFENIEAQKENSYVEYRIGKMYAAGFGTEQDYEEAAGWFGEAASKRHKYAQYSLAGLYYRGQGVEQSYKTALDLYRALACQRMPYASYELAKMYRDGVDAAPDSEEAELHFEDAFQGFNDLEKQSHDDKLQHRLGHMLYTGTGTERDVGAAIGYFEKAARLGNIHAHYMLGKLYLDENSGHTNVEQAIKWLTKAADNGNDLAQYVLGKMYLKGEDLPKDAAVAVKWLTASAEQGNQFAQYTLAKLYLAEENVPRNVSKALILFEQSAAQGNQYAQYQLGKLYLAGEDVPRDIPKALVMFEQSAAQGNRYAQYQLGKLYLLGDCVAKDVTRAINWLTAVAKQDNQFAQYALGKLYMLGNDVPRDREAAAYWLTLSAEKGNQYAQFFLDHLDSFRDPSLFLAVTRLLHHVGRIFQEESKRLPGGPGMQADSKLRRKLRQKKIAQGHAPGDHEHKFIIY